MNKLFAVLIAATFALGSAAALAQGDKTPPQPVDTAKLKAEREAAKAEYANMTPEERAAYKKGRAHARQNLLSEQEMKAMDQPRTTAAETKAIKDAKTQPKALQTKSQREEALEKQEKAPGAGGGN